MYVNKSAKPLLAWATSMQIEERDGERSGQQIAQELLAEDAFSLPIYYNVNPIVISKKLGNFKASGTNLGSFWNVYEWYLNK